MIVSVSNTTLGYPQTLMSMEMQISKNELGGTIDSWCGKCKLILAHTIEAMVGDKPVRVHCNTCKTPHSYKPNKPGRPSRQTSESGVGGAPERPRTRPSRHKSLREVNMAAARNYSFQQKFEPGDTIIHPTFGVGVATALKDETKIEVLFESGTKVLVHGRA